MSLLTTNFQRPVNEWTGYQMGQQLAKLAADGQAAPAYSMAGQLYLSPTGWLLLSVPAALVRGVFQALREPGIELPPGRDGQLEAHVSVMRPEEIAALGGPEKITERGKMFHYRVGGLGSVEPEGWPEMSRVWMLRVHSPELQQLRRSYGLSSLPNHGKYAFHISVAVRRKGVLGRNEVSK